MFPFEYTYLNMPTSPLTSQQLERISEAIEQTMVQLQSIEICTEINPMQYNARLCWERLYEARELLRAQVSTASTMKPRGNFID